MLIKILKLRLRGALVNASLFLLSHVFISDFAIRKVKTYLQTGKKKKKKSCYGTLIYLAEGKKSKS